MIPPPEPAPAPEAVYDLLYRLGITAVSSAFFHLACAVRLAAAQPQRVLIPAWIYPEAARYCQTTPEAVERSVRALSLRAWQRAPAALSHLAGAPLEGPPPPARFLAILAESLDRGRAA